MTQAARVPTRHRATTSPASSTGVLLAVVGTILAGCSVPPVGVDDTAIVDTEWPTAAHATISGTVLALDGSPIAGAHITTWPRGYEATSAADGGFAIERLPPDTYELLVAAAGFETGRVTGVEVGADETGSAQATLAPILAVDGSIAITVLGPDGGPLAGATVEIGATLATTDTEGWAIVTGLGGQQVDLQVSTPAATLWPRTVTALEVPVLGQVQLAVQLSGRPTASVTAGSTGCAFCHPTVAATYGDTAHARALSDEVEAPFLDWFAATTAVDLTGPTATLSLPGGVPTVTLSPTTGVPVDYVVAGVIGAGEQGQVPWTEIGDQAYPLPIAFVAADPERGAWPDRAEAVVPYATSRWFDVAGALVLPANGRPDPSLSAEAQCFYCHVSGFTATTRTDGGVDMARTGGSGTEMRWREPLVSCERCHGAGSSHVSATTDGDRYARIVQPELLDAERAIEVCGQCHGASAGDGNGLPFPLSETTGPFHPGATLADHAGSAADLWPSGAAASAGQQADELLGSAHWTNERYALRCFDCHEPHGAVTDGGGAPLPAMLRLDPRDNTLCLACHAGSTFADDRRRIEAHDGHIVDEQPAGVTQRGRCIACHMPMTASQLRYSPSSGAGDLRSHVFVALPPQDTLDEFDSRAAASLPPGEFPVHACAECHAYNAWRTESLGWPFVGPVGDPTLRTTQETFDQAFEAKFP